MKKLFIILIATFISLNVHAQTEENIEYKVYGQGSNALIWFNSGSGTSLPDYLQNFTELNRIFVVKFSAQNNSIAAAQTTEFLEWFIGNKEELKISKMAFGGNSLGSGVVLNAVVNHGLQPHSLLLLYPQSTWHIDKFIQVMTDEFPQFDASPYYSRYNIQLYGKSNPSEDDKNALDFLKPFNVPVWIQAYAASEPNSLDAILHNNVHAQAICEKAEECYINQGIDSFFENLNK